MRIDKTGRVVTVQAAGAGVATSTVQNPNQDKVPATPLPKRRLLVLAFPTDGIVVGDETVTEESGYPTRGTRRGAAYDLESVASQYSSRFQFMQGQYFYLGVSDTLDFYARAYSGAWEGVITLELA